MPIQSRNPATGEVVKTFNAMSADQVDMRLQHAVTAFDAMRETSFEQRASLLRASARILRSDREALATTMTTEMGKTIRAACAEVDKSAMACEWYADHGADLMADEPLPPEQPGAVSAHLRWQPIGPVLAVMPWNYPLWQVIRFAAPALMAGNVGLLKHASNVPQTALWIEDVFQRAGFPAGAFQTLLTESSQVERIIRDPRVRAVTLTGSTPAGRSVAAIAGDEIKPSLLELGGSDPFVVMPSANLERSVDVAVTARCQNNGQSCIAAKRFLIHDTVADRWIDSFVRRMCNLAVGDPLREDTDVGPLATPSGRDEVAALVDEAIGAGATVLGRGDVPEGPGWYYPPTVLSDVRQGTALFREEAFGPVAQVHRFSSVEEAVDLANATSYGLGSSVWTEDPQEREQLVAGIEAGAVFVNGMTASHPALPFGGTKLSGYGRELSGEGMKAFCNAKTVWVGDPSP